MANRYSSSVGTIFITSILLLCLNVEANEVRVRNETLEILLEGIKHIKKVSSQKERNIIKRIKVSVPISPAPVRVRAFKKNGKRIIELSTGYSAISRMIVSGYIIEDFKGIKNFGEQYARYTANTYATGRLNGGKPPWVKANLSAHAQKKLLSSRKFNETQSGAHILVLWYVLAHEVAHHVLNHKYGKKVTLSKIRAQEAKADNWANRVFISLGLPPASAFPSHMYWYFLDEYGVTSEYRRSHPPELKRIRSMLQQTINNFDYWNDNESLMPKLPKKTTINKYKLLLNHVENLISEQSNFNHHKLSSTAFKKCLNLRYKGCLKSCQEKYGYPLKECQSNLCVSARAKRIRKLRCYD